MVASTKRCILSILLLVCLPTAGLRAADDLAKKIDEVVLWRPEPGGPLEGTPNKFVQTKK